MVASCPMPSAQRVPPSEEVPWLRARVAELEADNEVMAAQLAARDAQLEAVQARLAVLAEQIEELRRGLGKDSSTSSKPPSSDSPYKKPKARSLRTRSGRKPGKQPGAPSFTLRQSADPDDTVTCGPAACGSCGADLADAPVIAVKKRQVFEAALQPPPSVIEYQVVAKKCPARRRHLVVEYHSGAAVGGDLAAQASRGSPHYRGRRRPPDPAP